MVIDPSQGEMWKNIAFLWYNKAVDKSPDVGRLYHHLAILARPFTLEQLSLYMRALTCFNPFENARSSILKLINPILQNKPAFQRPSFVTLFFQAHGNLFTSHFSDSFDRCDEAIEKLNVDGLYEIYISKASFRFKEFGVHAAVSNIAALLGSGTPKQKSSKPRLRLAYESAQRVKEQLSIPADNYSGFFGDIILSAESSHSEADISTFLRSSKLASISLSIPLKLANDRNVYPLVHVYLVFIWSLILVQQTWSKFEDDPIWKTIEKDFPWAAICSFLNTLAAIPHTITAEVWAEDFPGPGTDAGRPLPEDFVMRGQLFSRWYFPHTWFTDAMIDADERTIEVQSTDQSRATRMLWLGLRIASVSLIATFRENTNVLHAARWIHYDTGAKCFVVTDRLCTNANPFPDRTMEKT